MSPLEAARADLDALLAALDTIHPDAFHGIAREDWLRQMEQLKQRLPSLEPEQAMVELQELVALLSRDGRDGHQFALPIDEPLALPLQSYEFAEGVFVTAAVDAHRDLVGRQILAVDGHPIEEVLAALEPLVPRDGPATVPAFRPIFFHRISVLRGLGLVDASPVEFRLRDGAGVEADVSLDPVPFAEWRQIAGEYGVPLVENGTLYLSRPADDFWSRRLDDGSCYVRYTMVGSITSDELDAVESCALADMDSQVILDLRQNPGGDNHRYVGLLRMLQDESLKLSGRFFVLTDRRTFSAASNLATELEQGTPAVFVGEPMGGGLNFWDDVREVYLRAWPIPMQVGVSTRYWQKSTPDDGRLTIEPDLPFTVLAADYFRGRDPVLEELTGG